MSHNESGAVVEQPKGLQAVAQPTPSQQQVASPSGYLMPPGLEPLYNASHIIIRQHIEMFEMFTGINTNNRYEIFDSRGFRMYFAGEQSDGCSMICLGANRGFIIYIINNMGGVVLKLDRECSISPLCNNEVRIFTGAGDLIGRVSQEKCCDCCPTFTVFNNRGDPKLMINGPCTMCLCGEVSFQVSQMDGTNTVIGEIRKQWSGTIQELFTNADTFGVSFPVDLDPRLKALLIGAVFLIDFMFFEQQGGHRHHNHF